MVSAHLPATPRPKYELTPIVFGPWLSPHFVLTARHARLSTDPRHFRVFDGHGRCRRGTTGDRSWKKPRRPVDNRPPGSDPIKGPGPTRHGLLATSSARSLARRSSRNHRPLARGLLSETSMLKRTAFGCTRRSTGSISSWTRRSGCAARWARNRGNKRKVSSHRHDSIRGCPSLTGPASPGALSARRRRLHGHSIAIRTQKGA
jgi:hypothetical protein